ncbi:hypothetical protein [Phocoenobacter skyensis]|uniref:Uncharacterized protein n=1 Tax=Phocoenobacter skyensis TaxID=97481 RepID=A0A1H7ZSX8_9PAST|nr:hypothetical protein [Pasteurella skyensis]MDP8186043.1 hypothetical protein [Pasteurella skyensis]SEM61732.1 hypothetical protein SAMN05444853_13010 [Pasteurella skyensis]
MERIQIVANIVKSKANIAEHNRIQANLDKSIAYNKAEEEKYKAIYNAYEKVLGALQE